MFIAISKFTVANGMTKDVHDAFVNRPHVVDGFPGFVKLDVLSSHDNPDEVWLVTYWRDRDGYDQWHKSVEHHQTHKFIPKGLKLVPGSAQIMFFDHICS